jgi:triphosphatase
VPAEIELKLILDRSAISRAADLTRHPVVMAVRRGRPRTSRVVSSYYDTPDFALAKAGVTLRIRRDGTRWLQTVKGPPLATQGGVLHARDEHEWRLAQPRVDTTHLDHCPWHKLFRKVRRRDPLTALFVTDVVRRSVSLAFPGGTEATLAIDVGSIRTRNPPSRRCAIAEIEIEIDNGNAAPLFGLALALLDEWPLSVTTTNKASRGYALVRNEPDGWGAPVRAGYAEFAQDGPAHDALRAIAQGCLLQIAANASGLLADADPEWVHQMRIGTRRLRSCLSLIARVAGVERVRPLVAEIRWLADILGAARDWDVLATQTMPPLAAALGRDPAVAMRIKQLSRSIAARRSAARSAAQEAVRSQRFQRLLLQTGAFCAEPGFGGPIRAELSARAYANQLLAERHRRLLKLGAALENGTTEERHAVRIAAKKLRYAAEFFSPLNPGKRNRGYLKALSRLQDVLGNWHDTVTATRLAAGLAGKTDHGTVGAVRGWAAAHAAAVEPEIAGAWRRFAAADRFWARG